MSHAINLHDGTGILEVIPNHGISRFVALSTPSNGGGGYVPGCLFTNLTTGANYFNTGTVTSATWTLVSAATAITPPAGSPGTVATIQAAVNEIYQNMVSVQGFVPLPLPTWRAIQTNDIPALAGTPASGILASDSAPKLKRVNVGTDKAMKIEWAATSVIEIANQFFYPPDMDVTANFTVNLRTKMAAANDTPTIAVGVFEGIGDTNRGGNTGAASSSLTTLSVTVAPTTAHPNFAAISLIPGTHNTDALALHEAYILYKKKILTS